MDVAKATLVSSLMTEMSTRVQHRGRDNTGGVSFLAEANGRVFEEPFDLSALVDDLFLYAGPTEDSVPPTHGYPRGTTGLHINLLSRLEQLEWHEQGSKANHGLDGHMALKNRASSAKVLPRIIQAASYGKS